MVKFREIKISRKTIYNDNLINIFMDNSIKEQKEADIFAVSNKRITELEKQNDKYKTQYNKMMSNLIGFNNMEIEIENLKQKITNLERNLSNSQLEILEKNNEICRLQNLLDENGIENILVFKKGK